MTHKVSSDLEAKFQSKTVGMAYLVVDLGEEICSLDKTWRANPLRLQQQFPMNLSQNHIPLGHAPSIFRLRILENLGLLRTLQRQFGNIRYCSLEDQFCSGSL